MKITKGQLKRIVAEEYALVYRTRKPARRRVRKSNKALQERKYLARRKQELLREARAELWAEELLIEGLWDKLMGGLDAAFGSDKGVAGGIKKAYKATKVAAQESMDSLVDGFDTVKSQEEHEAIDDCVDQIADIIASAKKKATSDAVNILSKAYDKESSQTWAATIVSTFWANSDNIEEARKTLHQALLQTQEASEQKKQEKRANRGKQDSSS